MPHKLNHRQLLVVAVSVAAASTLPTCGVNDPALPNDAKGGAAGVKMISGGGTGGTTGGSSAGSNSVGIGGSSFDFGGSSAVVGTGGASAGAGGAGGAAGSAGGAAGGVIGNMCGRVTLMINDVGHI